MTEAPAQTDDDDDDDAPVAKQAAPVAKPAAPVAAAGPPADEEEAPSPKAVAAATPPAPKADPFGDVGFKEVNEKDWLTGIREKIAAQEKVAPTDLRLSPGLLRAVYVKSPAVTPPKPGRRVLPRRHEIVVVDNQGRRVASFRPVTAKGSDEPPKDLRFLTEERLVYEVAAPPAGAAPPKPARRPPRKPRGRGKGKMGALAAPEPPRPVLSPSPPPRVFVIQPVVPRARPIRCEGVHFAFSKERDHLAFVAGKAEPAFVSVDGAQVYPRRGRTLVATAPAWSKDGRSLAFLELPPTQPPRLVLVAELDNPTGDTTWELPPTTALEGVSVFWAGSGKLVVGKTALRPVFSASFTKER